MRTHRSLTALALAGVLVAAVTACGDDAGETADPEVGDTAAGGTGGGGVDLTGVCPDPIVIQTDWYATPERAAAYQLIGAGGEIDAGRGTYSGPLGDTGVEVEVRLGGPFIGFAPVPTQMYLDDSIFLGYVATDDAVQAAAELPTVAVVAPLDINPQILMWDPGSYEIEEWPDVAATDAPVLYLEGLPFMDYLVAQGYVSEGQLDASFDGTPSRFVAEAGQIIQQGYASNEPYRWEHDVEEWQKPVDFLLVHDSGYEIYPQGVAVRADELEGSRDCLEALVPLIQQAQIDYVTDPEPINATLVEIADTLGEGPPITADGNANAVEVMTDLDLVSNGPNDTLGDFDLDRVEDTIEVLRPIFDDRGTEVPDDLSAEDMVTNEFIDTSIGL